MKKLLNSAKQALFGLLRTEPITSTETLLSVCQECAKDQLKRDALTIQRDAEVQLVKDKYDADIETLNATIEHHLKRIHAWAQANRESHFGKRQSFVIMGHELAFRESPGAIGFAEGVSAEDVVQSILNMPEGEDRDTLCALVLRVKAELEKKAAQRELRANVDGRGDKLRAFGLRIVTEESFAFTPAREALPDVTETSPATSTKAVA
jgi:phage host-nuclease inhibitor protein Gam